MCHPHEPSPHTRSANTITTLHGQDVSPQYLQIHVVKDLVRYFSLLHYIMILYNTYLALNHFTLLNYVDRKLLFLCVIHCHSRWFMSHYLTHSVAIEEQHYMAKMLVLLIWSVGLAGFWM